MAENNGGNAGSNDGATTPAANAGAGNGTDTTAATANTTQANAGQTFTQADVDRVIAERLARERAKFAGFDELKTKAAELDQIKESAKTELQKANDALAAAHADLAVHKVDAVRRDAAAKAKLPPELAKYITASNADEALVQANELATRLRPPTADLHQGARHTAKPGASADDWIRRSAGR
jgi:hypothetical protein